MGRAIVALLACLSVLALAAPAAAEDVDEGALLERINAVRVDAGLRPLRAVPALRRVALGHARWMARTGAFTHVSAGGASPDDRIGRHYDAAAVGETLLWGSPSVSTAETVERWLASPAHRDVLLGRRFRDVGLGIVHVSNAPGAFSGLDVTIVVADLASPG